MKVKVRITGANCCEIDTDEGTYLQSYNTVVAFWPTNSTRDKMLLDRQKWNYSVTTARHRNAFTGLTTKETEARIKSGEIELVDLN